jgi:hypothetical protein
LRDFEARRPELDAAIRAYNETGAQLGGLHRTCEVWLTGYQRFRDAANGGYRHEETGAVLLMAPEFRQAALVPVLGEDGAFITPGWRMTTADSLCLTTS